MTLDLDQKVLDHKTLVLTQVHPRNPANPTAKTPSQTPAYAQPHTPPQSDPPLHQKCNPEKYCIFRVEEEHL